MSSQNINSFIDSFIDSLDLPQFQEVDEKKVPEMNIDEYDEDFVRAMEISKRTLISDEEARIEQQKAERLNKLITVNNQIMNELVRSYGEEYVFSQLNVILARLMNINSMKGWKLLDDRLFQLLDLHTIGGLNLKEPSIKDFSILNSQFQKFLVKEGFVCERLVDAVKSEYAIVDIPDPVKDTRQKPKPMPEAMPKPKPMPEAMPKPKTTPEAMPKPKTTPEAMPKPKPTPKPVQEPEFQDLTVDYSGYSLGHGTMKDRFEENKVDDSPPSYDALQRSAHQRGGFKQRGTARRRGSISDRAAAFEHNPLDNGYSTRNRKAPVQVSASIPVGELASAYDRTENGSSSQSVQPAQKKKVSFGGNFYKPEPVVAALPAQSASVPATASIPVSESVLAHSRTGNGSSSQSVQLTAAQEAEERKIYEGLTKEEYTKLMAEKYAAKYQRRR